MTSFTKGGMIILSSPSGAGKTTLTKKISKNKNYFTSISHTTRPSRPKEKNGKDYFFISKIKFKELIFKKEFLEYANVFNNFYGSSKKIVFEKLEKGQNVLFDIDWQGTKKIKKKKLKYKLLTVFILPPTKNELYKRLLKRERKNHVTVKKRMKQFKNDILHWKDYDYVVVNDDLIKCYKKIMSLISKKNKKKPFYDKKKIKKHIENLLS